MRSVMRFVAVVVTVLTGLAATALPTVAEAAVVAKVSVARQTMHVYVDGVLQHTWPVSTGRRGFSTPYGSYSPKRLARMHFSRKYDNSPMPYSVFFRGGFAVHGTGYVRNLGRPASHGCVRLAPGNAAQLFNLVGTHGLGASRIVIGN
jgi:lipoprotein-anchoring transpeptidase ErfK/SrfK